MFSPGEETYKLKYLTEDPNMFPYTAEQVRATAERILGSSVTLRLIGHHDLKRHLVYHLTNDAALSRVFMHLGTRTGT